MQSVLPIYHQLFIELIQVWGDPCNKTSVPYRVTCQTIHLVLIFVLINKTEEWGGINDCSLSTLYFIITLVYSGGSWKVEETRKQPLEGAKSSGSSDCLLFTCVKVYTNNRKRPEGDYFFQSFSDVQQARESWPSTKGCTKFSGE